MKCADLLELHFYRGGIGGSATSATWTTNGTGTFNNPNSLTASYTSSSADRVTGRVTLTLTTNDPSGVCGPVSDTIVVHFRSRPNISIVGSSSMCIGTPFQTTVTSGDGSVQGFQWYLNTNILIGAILETYTPTQSGAYSVTVTNNYGCTRTSSFSTTVVPNPSTANAGTDQSICGTTTNLAANSATVGSGIWSIISGSGGSLITPSNPVTAFNGTAGVSYTLRWTISNSPCTESTNDVVIVLNNNVSANAGIDQSVCGTSLSLSGNSPSPGTGAWTIISGGSGSFGNSANPNSTFTGNVSSVYTLRWTITTTSCTSFDDVIISLNPIPTVSVTVQNQSCVGLNDGIATATVLPVSGAYQHHWSFSSSTSNTKGGISPGTCKQI